MSSVPWMDPRRPDAEQWRGIYLCPGCLAQPVLAGRLVGRAFRPLTGGDPHCKTCRLPLRLRHVEPVP